MKPEMLQSQFATLEEPCGILTIDVALPQDEIVQKIMEQMMETKYSLGIIGLGVMGSSLAQNFMRNGYTPMGYVRSSKPLGGLDIQVTQSFEELAAALEPPRTVLLMVPAGPPVDAVIASLKPYLQEGDLIIDGGNSYFMDTERRVEELEKAGLYFIGMGVSGGESGALWGPSLMPGGSAAAWKRVEPMLQAIAAKAKDGEACVAWMGPGGAGHYVKMVHNGIEYGDMQLIAEIYDLLHRGAGIANQELADIFASWNQRQLSSYLVEITANILRRSDEETGQPMVDMILDEAEQKGTGKWTSQSALDIGAAIPTINAAVDSRLLSAMKEGACHRLQGAGGRTEVRRRSGCADCGGGAGSVCQQNHFLCPGSQPAEIGIAGVSLGYRPLADRAGLAGRLHHPSRLAERYHPRVSPGSGSEQSPAGRGVYRSRPEPAGCLAQPGANCSRTGHTHAGNQRLARLFRRLPFGAPASQPDPGAA